MDLHISKRTFLLQAGTASGAEGLGGLLWPAQDDLAIPAGQSDRPQSLFEVRMLDFFVVFDFWFYCILLGHRRRKKKSVYWQQTSSVEEQRPF